MPRRDLLAILDGTKVTVKGLKQYLNSSGITYFYRGKIDAALKPTHHMAEEPVLKGEHYLSEGSKVIIGQPCSLSSVAINCAERLNEGKAYEIHFSLRGRVEAMTQIYPSK